MPTVRSTRGIVSDLARANSSSPLRIDRSVASGGYVTGRSARVGVVPETMAGRPEGGRLRRRAVNRRPSARRWGSVPQTDVPAGPAPFLPMLSPRSARGRSHRRLVMAAMRSKRRSRPVGPAGDDLRRRLAVDAGVLAFLVGLALLFVVTAPT